MTIFEDAALLRGITDYLDMDMEAVERLCAAAVEAAIRLEKLRGVRDLIKLNSALSHSVHPLLGDGMDAVAGELDIILDKPVCQKCIDSNGAPHPT